MRSPAFAAAATIAPRSSFTPCHALSSRPRLPVVANPPRRPAISMVSQENLDRKQATVEKVKARLDQCQMIFSSNLSGLSVAQIFDLKRRLPKTTTVMTVKNTLMRRAIADSEWATAGEFTKDSNMWFFVREDMKDTVNALEKFVGELKRDFIKGGVYDGELCDEKRITAIAALPSKKELITQIAAAIQMVPTKLAGSVKAVPTKLARAIKMAVAEEEEGGAAPAQ